MKHEMFSAIFRTRDTQDALSATGRMEDMQTGAKPPMPEEHLCIGEVNT